MDNDNFLIEQESIAKAKAICNQIEDSGTRNRAMANVIAADIVKGYFQDIEPDTDSGIHNIAEVLKELDISDIYIKENYIDVRIFFNDRELCVPKKHFDLDITPVAYMFVKLNEDLTEGTVSGFIFPEDINTEQDYNGYYPVDDNYLKSFYDVNDRLITTDEEDLTTEFQKDVYGFLDKSLQDKSALYKILTTSLLAREYFKNAVQAKVLIDSTQLKQNTDFDEPTDDELVEETPLEELEEADDELSVDLVEQEELETLEDEDGFSLSEDVPPIDIDEDSDLPEATTLETNDDLLDEESNSLDIVEPLDSDDVEELVSDEEVSLLEETEDSALTEIEEVSDNDMLVAHSEAEPLNTGDDEEPEITEEIEEYEPIPLQEGTDNDSEDYTEPQQLIEEQVDSQATNSPQQEHVEVTDTEKQNDEFAELSQFDYSTEISPSIASIEAEEPKSGVITEEMLEASRGSINDTISEPVQEYGNSPQIESLFKDKSPRVVNTAQKKKGSVVPILGFLILLCAAGYFGYTKYFASSDGMSNMPAPNVNMNGTEVQTANNTKEVAMPIETVENVEIPKQTNEAVAVAIPAIEKNLNASIDISNLNVNWEVPTSYANNATARRYFMKLGKILQLNLKTELLILSNPPITNKISVALEFNKGTNRFNFKEFIDSSGTPNVDNVIKDTINKALDMNMSMNMNVFQNLQGSPVLIIKL